MYACFALEVAVGVLAFDSDRGGLKSCFAAFEDIEDIHLEAVSLAPACVHTVEHLVPVLSLGTACSRMEVKDSVIAVILTCEQGSERKCVDLICKGIQLLLDLADHILVVLFGSHFEHYLDIVCRLGELIVFFKSALERSCFLQHFL